MLMEGESGGGVADAWFLAGEEPDFDDIEADGDLFTEELEPAEGAGALFLAFVAVYRAGGGAGIGGGGGFDLAEDEGIALAADEVDFAGVAPAEVVAEDAHAMGTGPGGGDELAILPDVGGIGAGIRGPGAVPSVQQVQTSGDGVA